MEREIDEMIVQAFRWILTGYRNGQTGTLPSSIMGNATPRKEQLHSPVWAGDLTGWKAGSLKTT